MNRIRALWVWAKWTVESYFLPSGRHSTTDPDMRPGDDGQFAQWLHDQYPDSVVQCWAPCDQCRDWLQLEANDMRRTTDGKYVCVTCRKGGRL